MLLLLKQRGRMSDYHVMGIRDRLAARRRLFVLLLTSPLLALAVSPAIAGAAEITTDVWYRDGHTERWRIAGDWSFVPDPENLGLDAGWANTVPTEARQVQIPHVWNADLTEESFRGTIGWYFARFRPPHAGRYRVRFLSTHGYASAYIDGHAIGSHEGGFLTWETRPVYLDERTHLLAIRADNHELLMPPQEGGRGWWNWGGISREVELRAAKPVDVAAVRVGTVRLGRRSAVMRVAVAVTNPSDHPTNGNVVIALGGRSRGGAVAIPAQGKRALRFRVRLPNPRRWSAMRPHLHRLDVSTGTAGSVQRAWTGSVGVRRLRSKRGTLYLNGRRFYARGAALHDQARDVGAALTPADLRANIDLLRGLHANFTRAHYPVHPGFLEMLDRAGIVLWAEAPVAWISSRNMEPGPIRDVLLRYMRETIDAQASHASVGMWSAGNELAAEAPRGRGFVGYVRAARSLVRALDPTRPFALAFESREPEHYRPFCRLLDVFGLNYYLGWYWGPPPGIKHRRALRSNVRSKVAACGRRPWMVTEFGAEAGSPGSSATRGTYAYQEALITSTLRGLRGLRHLNGATIWAGRDFAVSPGWTGGNPVRPNPPINQKGLVTLTGRRKPAYYAAARMFQRLTRRAARR